ncbi:MAG: hypothetical protein K6F92_04435 [Lachnospiraceae bacterium]|nr:hypothetical protein [Lachnospiraceae bacterium]
MKYSFSFIITPIIVIFLKTEELGLWYTFASINAFACLLDLGFSQNFLRNFAFAWGGAKELEKEGVAKQSAGEPNKRLYSILLSASSKLYLVISSVAFIALLIIGTPYILYIMRGYEQSYLVPWLVYAFAIFINLMFGWWFSALEGAGKIAKAQQAITIGNIANFVVVIVCMFLRVGLIGLALAYLINGLVSRAVAQYYFHKNVITKQEIAALQSDVSSSEIKQTVFTIWFNAKKNAVVTLAETLSGQLGTIICSGVISVEVTASYGLCCQIANIVTTIAVSNHTANMPVYANLWTNDDKQTIRKLYSRAIFAYMTISIVIGVLAIVFGVPVIRIIKPSIELPYMMLLLVIITYVFDNLYSSNAKFIATKNKIPYVKDNIIALILVILLYILLLRGFELGVYGLIVGKVLGKLFLYIKWNHYAFKMVDCSFLQLNAEGCRYYLSKLKTS